MDSTELLPAAGTGTWCFEDRGSGSVTLICAQLQLPVSVTYKDADSELPNYSELSKYADLDALIELYGHIRSSNLNDLRFNIDGASRLRSVIADELSRCDLQSGSVVAGQPGFLSPLFSSAAITTAPKQPTVVRSAGSPLPAKPSARSGKMLLRLIDGILAALCLLLVRILSALSQISDAVPYVCMVIATSHRYGRRDEPASLRSLPPSLYLKSQGRVPAAC